ncbi:GlxA family transcriptional regulator [Pectobacterium brasiliense]|uniref:GlxA family transcriptional regulator n=1 Tax=Pectobacterium brasiliense TaxID=180957 RepID=UPI00227C8182|nr:helix-turn-helix domain-containing protein [Pectobacterium brasiliense]WGL29773.1 helix-turn-helix domain-containing protein [Pectobacterium brasiliense]
MSTVTVAIVITEGFSTFHLSVPLILFSDAVTEQKLFVCRICAEQPGIIWSDDGTAVRAEYNLDVLPEADIVIIPFWNNVKEKPSQHLMDTLVAARGAGASIVGLCLGGFVVAYAGLLDGHRAATHWEYEKIFHQLFPKVRLDVNVLYTEDDGLVTSAGTAAALDCCLYLIRQRFGNQLANRIARRMVVPPHRDGGQAQFIEQVVPRSTTDNRINMLLDYLQRNLHQVHNIDSLARFASMSRRTLTRHFLKATGMSVGDWLTTERLHRSQELLEITRLSVEQVSDKVGFQSVITFRQIFRERTGVSPSDWRKTFRGTNDEGNQRQEDGL